MFWSYFFMEADGSFKLFNVTRCPKCDRLCEDVNPISAAAWELSRLLLLGVTESKKELPKITVANDVEGCEKCLHVKAY